MGFSIETRIPSEIASRAKSLVAKYSLLACSTLYKSRPAIPGSPIGNCSERNCCGGVIPASFNFACTSEGNFLFLAAEQVPHGGAK